MPSERDGGRRTWRPSYEDINLKPADKDEGKKEGEGDQICPPSLGGSEGERERERDPAARICEMSGGSSLPPPKTPPYLHFCHAQLRTCATYPLSPRGPSCGLNQMLLTAALHPHTRGKHACSAGRIERGMQAGLGRDERCTFRRRRHQLTRKEAVVGRGLLSPAAAAAAAASAARVSHLARRLGTRGPREGKGPRA